MNLEFFINPDDASQCEHVIERMNKLRLPVLELYAARTREMNGHSVAFVPTPESRRRVGRHTHLQEVYVRYVGAPGGIAGPAAACSGIIEVGAWEVGRADKKAQKDRLNVLASQLSIAIKNAELELERRAKKNGGGT